MTLWDECCAKKTLKLEKMFYNTKALNSGTRCWLLDKAKQWPNNTKFLDAGCGGGVVAAAGCGCGLGEGRTVDGCLTA